MPKSKSKAPHTTKGRQAREDASPIAKGSEAPKVPKKKARKASKDKWVSKTWFLTFSQCPLSREEIRDNLLRNQVGIPAEKSCDGYPIAPYKVLSYLICQEKHEDGGLHIHMFFRLEEQVNTRRCVYWDHIARDEYHANMQTPRDVHDVITYIAKYDTSPLLFNVDIEKSRAKHEENLEKKTRLQRVLSDIESGMTLEELRQEHSSFFFVHKKKIVEYFNDNQMKKRRDAAVPWLSISYNGEDANTRTIVDWLSVNMGQPRKHKQPQLWVCGPPNTNKTYLMRDIVSRHFLFWKPALARDVNTGVFYDGYSDSHDYVFIDEYKCQFSHSTFNEFTEGGYCSLQVKGGTVIKNKNIPVIVCSNHLPSEYFRGVDYQSLMVRFLLVQLEKPIDIENIVIVPQDKGVTPQEVLDKIDELMPK